MGYASYTGTLSTKDALRRAGWRFFMTPILWRSNGRKRPVWSDGSPAPFALDNGAWTAHTKKTDWDSSLFKECLNSIGSDADFVCVPDKVGDRAVTLEMMRFWAPQIQNPCVVVQDGMTPEDLRHFRFTHLAIGGSTDWKLKSLRKWCHFGNRENVHVHVLRVNTMRRIHLAAIWGAKSFDGSGPVRFPCTLPKLERARHQLGLFGGSDE